MKISKKFALNKSQAELDFVDIDTKKDTPLFLDPFFLGNRLDRWSIEATLLLRNFFQRLIELIQKGDEKSARELFEHLGEDNSTCLGVSNDKPEGRGPGEKDSINIYDNLLKSRAIQTGLIQDIEDSILFVDRFGKDKLSDMTTNIIKRQLLEYTNAQCDLHNIALTDNIPSGYYWSSENLSWEINYTKMLVVDGKPITLVPKGIVSFSESYTSDKYYNHFVLNFLQHEHLKMNSALVQKRKNGTRFVTKKDLKEENPNSKEFLRRFTLKYPEVLVDFKTKTKTNTLKNIEITDIGIKDVCKSLGERLIQIASGNPSASEFHNTILGVLELLFYPHLINPRKEAEIHNGRKRIDITFDNAAREGIFYRLSENLKIPCGYIFVECKNYSADIANPELDQLSGRFSTNRGKVGFLICRNFLNRSLFIERCKDTFKDDRGLIIPIIDSDIINMLDNYNENDDLFFDNYISNLIREITLA